MIVSVILEFSKEGSTLARQTALQLQLHHLSLSSSQMPIPTRQALRRGSAKAARSSHRNNGATEQRRQVHKLDRSFLGLDIDVDPRRLDLRQTWFFLLGAVTRVNEHDARAGQLLGLKSIPCVTEWGVSRQSITRICWHEKATVHL